MAEYIYIPKLKHYRLFIDTKPTEYDQVGCDGLYFASIEFRWWALIILPFELSFNWLLDRIASKPDLIKVK